MKREGKLTATPWNDNNWTKARYFSFIRSALRKATMRYPAKQKYLISKCRPAPKGHKARYLVDCEQCGKTVAKSNAHVDHIIACGSLKDFKDIEQFVKTLFCGVDNFAVLCEDCNQTFAYADKMGVSFEDALLEKKVLTNMKDLSISEQKLFLLSKGFKTSDITNDEKRRECFRALLKQES